jgi:hypothetical protein
VALRDLHYVTLVEAWGLLLSGLAVGLSWRRVPWYLLAVALFVVLRLWRWRRGRCGLDQYPHPYGRHYDEWMRGGENLGDYYPWLAKRMHWRDPWRLWVEFERPDSYW